MALPQASRPGFLRVHIAFHESQALGAGRSILQALEPLALYGWTASCWFPEGGALADEARLSLATDVYHGAKPIRYSARGWRAEPGLVARLRDTPAYLRAFRRSLLRSRPHLVHANTLRTLPEARVARRLGLPVVLHVHELPAPGAKRSVVLRAAAASADVLVCVSQAVAAVVRAEAGATPVLVAHNGVPSPARKTGDPTSGIVGTIGTSCHVKGTDVFLEAAALAHERRPELRFEHVGQSGLDEDAAFAQRVDALARRPPLATVASMLGRRPAAESLERWELFVLASRQDAFPLATLEAMAAGVPVLATSVGGIVEQIEHLETGVLVPPESPQELAEWIVRLHDDRGLRDSLAAAAGLRVRDRFTVERQASAVHEAYLAALNLRHGPPPVRSKTLASVGGGRA